MNEHRGRSEKPRAGNLLFTALLILLIAMGALGLGACFWFFIQNQININTAYQDMKNATYAITIDRAEYIKTLSEAQASASTKDIMTLLYGFMSTAILTVGLRALSETQTAAEKVKKNLIKAQTLEKKISAADDHLASFYRKTEMQGEVFLLQTYIEQTAIDVQAFELFLSLTPPGQNPSLPPKAISSRTPRIRDSLLWTCQLLDQLDASDLPSDEKISMHKFFTIYRRSINEMKNSFASFKLMTWPYSYLTADFEEFYDRCELISQKFNLFCES